MCVKLLSGAVPGAERHHVPSYEVYDNYLRGKDGAEYWGYDSHGRRLSEYVPARKQPVAGRKLTIQ